jgi:RNA polymerase sigma-70 factor (ECF subfamily)
MTDPACDAAQWLALARAGSPEALGQVLETFRGYLLLIAAQELDPELRAKGGASDLVQETFLEAQRDFPHFDGTRVEELRAWLRKMLINNVANFTRHYRTVAMRDVGREVSLEAGGSSHERGAGLVANSLSPSEHALAHEQAEAVARARERLAPDYRQVLALRHEGQLTFEEIGQRMQRTANAARMLWLRAVEQLQNELGLSQ